jgi:F420 biosynthesis protein FbiB-like protein
MTLKDAKIYDVDLLFTRRSIRLYRPDSVPRELVEAVLEAANWSPSAHNRQPWRFAVVTDQSAKAYLAWRMGERLRIDLKADQVPQQVIDADVSRSYTRISKSPVVIVLCLSMKDMDSYTDEQRNQNEFLMAVQSVAMAGQNLLLASHGLGLGACWMCAPLFCQELVRDVLDLPDDWQPQGLITLGYPAEEKQKTRKPLETSVIWR